MLPLMNLLRQVLVSLLIIVYFKKKMKFNCYPLFNVCTLSNRNILCSGNTQIYKIKEEIS
jgi:hypothetical protein